MLLTSARTLWRCRARVPGRICLTNCKGRQRLIALTSWQRSFAVQPQGKVDDETDVKEVESSGESPAPAEPPRPEDAGVIFRVDLRKYFRAAGTLSILQLGWWASLIADGGLGSIIPQVRAAACAS